MNKRTEFEKYAVHHLGMSSNGLNDYNKKVTNMTPFVIEESQMRATVLDVFSRLMMDRVIFLGTPIDEYVANVICAQLLFLRQNEKDDINIYINSPGGSVYDGLGIYDTMQYIDNSVNTLCLGMAASMGAVLLAAGNDRKALKHSRIMIHQPSAGIFGTSSDMEIGLKQTIELRKDLYTILANHTGQTFEKIDKDSDRDYWMRATEAKEYGMIDEVIERTTPKKKTKK